ncbi:hypothetical protein LX36DRAFT_403263 [Colletotrichum falcatum]|nr:hypothetical protein LX36DRAFT_403263 [Colletotrichum falcatum]
MAGRRAMISVPSKIGLVSHSVFLSVRDPLPGRRQLRGLISNRRHSAARGASRDIPIHPRLSAVCLYVMVTSWSSHLESSFHPAVRPCMCGGPVISPSLPCATHLKRVRVATVFTLTHYPSSSLIAC